MSDYAEPLSALEIHLDRITENYLSLKKRLLRGADCAAVVKADAYGLGAAAVVPELYKANCRHFYVAHASEGLAVRASLPDHLGKASVSVLHGPRGMKAQEFLQHELTPVLNSLGDLEYWSSFAKEAGRKLPAILHIDTGMNRLGLSGAEVKRLKNTTDLLKPLDIRYIMSHLACADEQEHPMNKQQLEKFKTLIAELGLPCRLSFANSSGIFLGNDYHFDQVRPGCALYGIKPTPGQQSPVHDAITLKLCILQIREIAAGETAGYSAAYKASAPVKLATISVGYADGILRCIGQKGMVAIGGQKCPIVGRVSMDTIIVDVTAVKAPLRVGDFAELIGPHQTIDEVAAQAGTIGYEILTSLGKRYARTYTGQEKI